MATAETVSATLANRVKSSLLLVAAAAASFVFVNQSLATARIKRESTKLLVSLAKKKDGTDKIALPTPSDLRRAVAAQPYAQDVVNAAVVARYFRDHDEAKLTRGMKRVDRLGWRSTTALQNSVQLTMESGLDIGRVADVADALLRREKIVEQATMLMNYMEMNPKTRAIVASKLAQRPTWRSGYLANVASLKAPQQFVARGLLLEDIFARNDRLTRDELSPSLSVMTAAGLVRPAYAIWRKFEKRPAALLNDPRFELAAKVGVSPYFAIPFEWQFGAANGYWSEVFRDGDDTLVRINWNGKFVPELMRQQTVLDPGSYRLVVTGQAMDSAQVAQLDFALSCDRERFGFDRVVSRNASRLILAMRAPSTCSDPLFVVAGQPAITTDAGVMAGAVSFGTSNEVSIVLKSIDIMRGDSAAVPASQQETFPRPKGS